MIYHGRVIAKKYFDGHLGKGIRLYVDFGKDIRRFESANWVLKYFCIGDKVSWQWSIFDPRGTSLLRKEGI